jgi:hypothetical protein
MKVAFIYGLAFGSIIALCIANLAYGGEALKLRKFNFEVGRYMDNSRDGYITTALPNETLDMRPKIDFDFDFYCTMYDEFCVYLNQNVIGKSTSHQYRYVSWVLEGGFSFRNVDFFYWHQSQHGLESNPNLGRYPNENVAGIRLKLWDKPRSRGWDW